MLGRILVLKRTKQLQAGQICIMMNFEVYILTKPITKMKTKRNRWVDRKCYLER